jgi:hypothetical protein
MKNQSIVNTQEHEAWPRGFDIRAQYAEQQELLTAEFSEMVDIAPPRDIPLQGKDKND